MKNDSCLFNEAETHKTCFLISFFRECFQHQDYTFRCHKLLTHTNNHLRPWEVARISSQHICSIVIANCKGGSLVWLIVCLDPWLILSSILVRKPPHHTPWVSVVEYNVWTSQLHSILLCTLGWDFKCTWQQSLPVGPVETGTTFFSLPAASGTSYNTSPLFYASRDAAVSSNCHIHHSYLFSPHLPPLCLINQLTLLPAWNTK